MPLDLVPETSILSYLTSKYLAIPPPSFSTLRETDFVPFGRSRQAYNSGIPAEDVCITSLSILSPLWKVTSLLPADTTGEQEGEERRIFSTPIPWQQISNLALAIDRVEDGLKQCKESIAWSVGQVEGLLLGKKVDESKVGNVDLNFSTISSSVRFSCPLSNPFRYSTLTEI